MVSARQKVLIIFNIAYIYVTLTYRPPYNIVNNQIDVNL